MAGGEVAAEQEQRGDGPVLLSLHRAHHPTALGQGVGKVTGEKQHRTRVTSGDVLQKSLN